MQVDVTSLSLLDTHDPAIFASNLTAGTLVLANESANEAAFGVVAMVLGCILCVPLAVLSALAIWHSRRQRPQLGALLQPHTSLEDLSALQDDSAGIPES